MNANSLAAYRKIGEFLEGHNLIIYEMLLEFGPLNCWDIARYTGFCEDGWLDTPQVFRRMRDLERAGFVERMDWVQNSPSGRDCSVWWVKA